MEPFVALLLIALLGMGVPIILVLGALTFDVATLIYVAITGVKRHPRPRIGAPA